MRHEIYATTFYGPLCLFGKNIFIRKLHERRKRPILSEMHEFWIVCMMKAVILTFVSLIYVICI